LATEPSLVCPETSTDGESLQSSKGLLHVIINKNGGCVGRYQAITGNLELTDRLHEGALQFLANHYMVPNQHQI
jgi:hypothetical protein